MAIHNVFFGGDGAHRYDRHSFVHDASAGHVVRYEGLLLNRHIVLPFYFDAGKDSWRHYTKMEGKFAVGDTLRTHLVGAHALLTNLVFHNKLASGLRNDRGEIETATQVEVSFIKGDGSPVDNTQAVTIDLSKVGTTVINATGKVADAGAAIDMQQVFTTEKVYVQIKLNAGTLDEGCFSAFLELVDMYDVRGCTCVAAPCETEYPNPLCPPGGLVP